MKMWNICSWNWCHCPGKEFAKRRLCQITRHPQWRCLLWPKSGVPRSGPNAGGNAQSVPNRPADHSIFATFTRHVGGRCPKIESGELFNKEGNENTVWRIQDFSVIQILREINFEYRSFKNDIFSILETLNFGFSKFEPFLKSQIQQNSKLRVSEMVKMVILWDSNFAWIYFTQNWVANKFLNYGT